MDFIWKLRVFLDIIKKNIKDSKNNFVTIVKYFECQDGHVHLRGSLSRYVNQYLLFNCLCFFFYSLHLGIQSGPCEEELIRLDEAYVQNKYKVSIINTIALSKNTAD